MNIFKQTLDHFKKQQQILAILVFALIAIMIWIATDLFTSQTKTTISPELLKLAKPLTPSIDEVVIARIRQKGIFSEAQLQDFPIFMVVKDQTQNEQVLEIGTEPEPSPSPSPAASPATLPGLNPNNEVNSNTEPNPTSLPENSPAQNLENN